MQLNRSGAATQHLVLLVLTQLDVSVYSRSSTRRIVGGMPTEWRRCHRQSRSTESNAALRSVKAIKSARFFSEFVGIFSEQSNGGYVIRC